LQQVVCHLTAIISPSNHTQTHYNIQILIMYWPSVGDASFICYDGTNFGCGRDTIFNWFLLFIVLQKKWAKISPNLQRVEQYHWICCLDVWIALKWALKPSLTWHHLFVSSYHNHHLMSNVWNILSLFFCWPYTFSRLFPFPISVKWESTDFLLPSSARTCVCPLW
jgi:hypothetical protein